MTRYVALLRAVNITTRPLKMERLRALLGELGLTNVATYIASGNALFDAAPLGADEAAEALEERIEAHLHAALGFAVDTFLRTAAQMKAIAAHRPFDAAETDAAFGQMVAFLKQPPDADQTARLMTYRRASDDFAVHEREVYWLRRTQQSETNFAGATLERALKMPTTVRSITTVRKLAELAGKS
jgi:uncharacterized protein (DUF1697 family)